MRKKYNLNLTGIGSRLRQVRESLKLTLEKIHDLTGFSVSLISAAENGQKKPSAIYLAALHELFNVNLHFIFTGKGQPFLSKSAGKDGKPQFSDTYEEMLYFLENFEMVRYAIMTEYLKFKIQHPDELKKILEGKK